MIFQPKKKRWLYFLGLKKGQTRLKRLLASDAAAMQCIYAKAFKMVTRQALKNVTYCYDLYRSHKTSGFVNIFFSVSLYQVKPNSCMYPFSEKLVIIFLLNCAVCAPRARTAQSSKKMMTSIVESLLLKSFQLYQELRTPYKNLFLSIPNILSKSAE